MRAILLLLIFCTTAFAGNKCLKLNVSFATAAKRNTAYTAITDRMDDFCNKNNQSIRSFNVVSSTNTNTYDVEAMVWFIDFPRYANLLRTVTTYLSAQNSYIRRGKLTEHTCPNVDTLPGKCEPCAEEIIWSK